MLRILLVLAVVVGIVLWWKQQQRGRTDAAVPPPVDPPEAMLRCAECGVHMPASQALPGRGGAFCSAEHRTRFEDRG